MSELRLKLARPEPVKMQADIREALNDWRALNSPRLDGTFERWARFECAQIGNTRVVCVEWGYKIHDFQEKAIQTIYYTLRSDGTVSVQRTTHR